MPWVARGAGSGLSGGALPIADGVLIVVSRMKRVLEIDLDNHRICVEPGVTNANVSAVVGPGVLLSARPVEPDRLLDRRQRRRELRRRALLQVRLHDQLRHRAGGRAAPTARWCRSAAMELDHPGYDLLGAFVGSEGTLGVATKVWLRVVPSPETVKTLVAFFDTTRHAGEAVSQIVQAGVVPGRDRDDGREGDRGVRADGPRRLSGRAAGAALLVELDGAERECEARFEEVVGDLRGLRLRRRARRRATRPSGRCSGRRARPRSRRWAASRRTTSSRTA